MSNSKELNRIKKLYGEKFMHFCRSIFPTLLEQEGLLTEVLKSTFATNSRTLYDDIVNNDLEEEFNNLKKIIKALELILSDEENLKAVMKDELRKIKKEYATDRITEIKDEITEIKIDTESMIPKEDCIVVVTRDGYIKRTSYRSYSAVSSDMPVPDNSFR